MNSTSLPWSEATERNRVPILEVLAEWLPDSGTVLEIGSGTGQHAVYFESRLSGLEWQPSDCAQALPGLAARIEQQGGPGILPPLCLDVMSDPWPAQQYAAAYSANTAHIMSWEAVKSMFAGIGECLTGGALFFLYGPFLVDGRFTTESNRQFDQGLRQRNAEMGVRDISALESVAGRHQMNLECRLDMPANNFILIFRKETLV